MTIKHTNFYKSILWCWSKNCLVVLVLDVYTLLLLAKILIKKFASDGYIPLTEIWIKCFPLQLHSSLLLSHRRKQQSGRKICTHTMCCKFTYSKSGHVPLNTPKSACQEVHESSKNLRVTSKFWAPEVCVTWSKYHSKDPKISGTTTKNSAPW
jgi:hypothetical protein